MVVSTTCHQLVDLTGNYGFNDYFRMKKIIPGSGLDDIYMFDIVEKKRGFKINNNILLSPICQASWLWHLPWLLANVQYMFTGLCQFLLLLCLGCCGSSCTTIASSQGDDGVLRRRRGRRRQANRRGPQHRTVHPRASQGSHRGWHLQGQL